MGTVPSIELGILGWADGTILMILALIVFGPRKLPEIGRQIGKLMYEFRKASNDFKFQMEEELRQAEEADRRQAEEARQKKLAATSSAPVIEAAVTETALAESSHQGEYPFENAGTPPEEAYPQIKPPATGEPVGADWKESPHEAVTESSTAELEPEKSAADAPAGITEQATQHG